MATPNPRELQRLINQLNEIEKRISAISGNPVTIAFEGETDPEKIAAQFGSVDKAIDFVNKSIKRANTELETFTGALGATRSIVKDINAELKRINDPVKKARQSFGRIDSLVQQMTYNQADLNSLSVADIESQKRKSKLYFDQIKLRKEELKTARTQQQEELAAAQEAFKKDPSEKNEKAVIAKRQELNATRELLSIAEGKSIVEENINDTYDSQIKRIENMNSGLGISGKIVEGIGGTLEKLGFKGFSSEIDKAKQKMKDLSVKLSENGEKAVGLGGKFKVLGEGLKSLRDSLIGVFQDPLFYLGLLAKGIQKLVGVFTHLDDAVGKTARGLGLTRSAATALVKDFKDLASASGDTFINMDRLMEAQLRMSKTTGINVRLTGEQLANQARLAEFVGLTDSELANVYRSTILTGKSQSELYDSVVDTNDTIFSSNELFREAANITGELAMLNGNNVTQIAKGVAAAKRMGINMAQARDMAMGTLDFESSIRAEMELAAVTGESINLNRARELAFQGKFNAAVGEMLKQKAVQKAFETGNVMAQRMAAKALGMSVDELANMRAEMIKNAKLEQRQREIMEEISGKAYETLTAEEKKAIKGEASLKALRESQTTSERLADASAKIADFFGTLILPATEKVADAIESFSKFLGFSTTDSDKVAKSTTKIKDEFDKVKKTTDDVGGKITKFQEDLQKAFGVVKDYPVLSTLAAVAGGALVFKGLGKLKDTVLGKMGLGKLGTAGNPMHVTMSGGGGLMDLLNPKKKKPGNILKMLKKPGQLLKNLGPKLLKGSGVLSLVGAGVNLVDNLNTAAQSEDKGIGDALARTLDENKFMALGAAIGSVVPGVGTLVGAGIGGILDFANKSILGEKGMVTDSLESGDELEDFVIKSLPQDSLVMAGGTQFGKETNDLLRELIAAVNQGGDVVMDGVKVGSTLQMASYKL